MNRTVALLRLLVLIVAPAYGKAGKGKSDINIATNHKVETFADVTVVQKTK